MINKDKKDIQFEQPSDILLLVNRYIMFIIAFIILSILVLGYFFVLNPKINNTSYVEEENITTEERRIKNQGLLDKLKELEAEYQDIINNRKEDLIFLKKIVPVGSHVAELFLVADNLAKEHNFQLENIDINENLRDKVSKKDTENEDTVDNLLASSGVKSMTIRLSISKKVDPNDDVLGLDVYSEFKDYLSELENSVRLFDVQAISFKSIDAEITKEASYTFDLDLISYYQ